MHARAARGAATVALLGGAILLATSASAAEPEQPEASGSGGQPRPFGPRVGLRSGVAIPIGTVFTSSGAMDETMSGYVPLRLDIGYRLASRFYVGVNAQYAVIVPRACPSGASCTGGDMRVGMTAAFHLLPRRLVDPWIGLGMGFEWMNVSRTVDGATVDVNARGLELFDAELGVDLRPIGPLRIGPVLSTSIGRYTRIAVNGTQTTDFTPSLHSWVMVGFRGAFDM
jgi:hypothetical protein